METNEEFRARVRRGGQIAARLRLARGRLEEAQQERIWGVVEAHQSGLSIRQIAAATGLSPSRVHQLLGSEEARGRDDRPPSVPRVVGASATW